MTSVFEGQFDTAEPEVQVHSIIHVVCSKGCAVSAMEIFKTRWGRDLSKPAELSKGLPEIAFNLIVIHNIS